MLALIFMLIQSSSMGLSTDNHDDTLSNEQRSSTNVSINVETEVMVMAVWGILVFGGHDSGYFREYRHCDGYGWIQFGSPALVYSIREGILDIACSVLPFKTPISQNHQGRPTENESFRELSIAKSEKGHCNGYDTYNLPRKRLSFLSEDHSSQAWALAGVSQIWPMSWRQFGCTRIGKTATLGGLLLPIGMCRSDSWFLILAFF